MLIDPPVSQTDQIEEQDHQRRLAISLVVNLGFESVVHRCQANSWDGVLKWVLALKETDGGITTALDRPEPLAAHRSGETFLASQARIASKLRRKGSLTETF